ncbi:MAG: site-2 protease family protein [Oscillospiraceae bacterium]|nr:site-2 protease family protein [Oscillospiraceae bacterium]
MLILDCGLDFYARGIRIRLTFGFLAVWAFLLIQGAFSRYAAVAAVCCALHEMGHLGAMKLFGIRVRGLTFFSGGIKIRKETEFCSSAAEMAVLAAGPFVNLLLAVLGFAVGDRLFSGINLALMLFNLLPVSVLDGGRIFKAAAERFYPMTDISPLFRITDFVFGLAAAFFFFRSGSVSFTLPLTLGIAVLEGLGEKYGK